MTDRLRVRKDGVGFMYPYTKTELITDNNNNALSNQKDAIISIDNIEYINYKPNSNTFSVIDHFTFKLFVDSKYSPMTIISIVICDEGCSACDENFAERAIEKKECYECRANYYGYKKS